MMLMTRITVDVDARALVAARRVLGTKGLSETVNVALREATRRRVLQGFDVRRDIYGTPTRFGRDGSDSELQEEAGVPLVHYDRDYERVAAVTDLRHLWMVPDGSLA
jgi:hypothetical protein